MKLEENKDFEYTDKLELTTKAHYTAVVEEDEYKVNELFDFDKDIKYIVDIGANVGTASYQFHKFFPEAKILVCEPEPELLGAAKINTGNKLTYVEEAIIGDDRKEVTFNVCKWEGNGHVEGNFRWDLFEKMGSKLDHKITVPASTLKDLIDRYEFPQIDLLKIDTEGMEGQILTAFKPYMHLVKHFRGEWHGDIDREIIREALKDTHDIYINRKLTTHGDCFATRKDISEALKKVEDYGTYKMIRRVGLPHKIVYG
ncbi:FkbM family methyltransferase [Candidatus Dojkabacteria bacterium]|jgi:FkbM family methyltransferase|nr:FkbM family methyltransferase [Candidatus Dojkabacteria bacterium]